MDANLLTAYNYLSSAIAQAFAALIALTAMFYIYRMGAIRNQLKEKVNLCRIFLAWRESNDRHPEPNWIDRFMRRDGIMEFLKRISS